MVSQAERFVTSLRENRTYQVRSTVTTPAENRTSHNRSRFVINMGSPVGVDYTYGTSMKIRPASGSSPVRKDGTRPPRGWDHRWTNLRSPLFEIQTEKSNGTNKISGTVPLWDNTGSNIVNQVGAGWVNTSGVFPPSPRAAARSKLLTKLTDARANWGQTMGEAKKTVEGISAVSNSMLDFVNQMAKYYRMEKRAVTQVLSGKKVSNPPKYAQDLKRAIKEIPSGWLQLQFGLKPLLGDIHQSSEALSWMLFEERDVPKMVVRAGHTDTSVGRTGKMSTWSPGYQTILKADVVSSCHLSCTYQVPVSSTRTVQQLGLGNPYSVAYELAPWSWALDYVSTTGDWVNSLFANEGTSFLEGSETLLMKVGGSEGMFEFSTQPYPGYVMKKGPSQGLFDGNAGRMQRTVLNGPPLPWYPTFRNRLGLNQMANLMSALSQVFR